jgi:hypothetical protein
MSINTEINGRFIFQTSSSKKLTPYPINIARTILTILCISISAHLAAQDYSVEVSSIIQEMDSVLDSEAAPNNTYWLESRTIGEGGSKSIIYTHYKVLLETAETHELLKIIADTTLKPPIRGYSYMAYAYQIDSLQIPEQPIDCDFNLNVQIGCIGSPQTFQDFKKRARVRGLNNPYPRKSTIPAEEYKVIKLENKIREEQAVPIRVEKTKD